MKKILSISLISITVMSLLLAACKKSFVEIDPEGVFAADTYYKDQQQAFTGLVAVYDVLTQKFGWL